MPAIVVDDNNAFHGCYTGGWSMDGRVYWCLCCRREMPWHITGSTSLVVAGTAFHTPRSCSSVDIAHITRGDVADKTGQPPATTCTGRGIAIIRMVWQPAPNNQHTQDYLRRREDAAAACCLRACMVRFASSSSSFDVNTLGPRGSSDYSVVFFAIVVVVVVVWMVDGEKTETNVQKSDV